jgi:hypothetical protein
MVATSAGRCPRPLQYPRARSGSRSSVEQHRDAVDRAAARHQRRHAGCAPARTPWRWTHKRSSQNACTVVGPASSSIRVPSVYRRKSEAAVRLPLHRTSPGQAQLQVEVHERPCPRIPSLDACRLCDDLGSLVVTHGRSARCVERRCQPEASIALRRVGEYTCCLRESRVAIPRRRQLRRRRQQRAGGQWLSASGCLPALVAVVDRITTAATTSVRGSIGAAAASSASLILSLLFGPHNAKTAVFWLWCDKTSAAFMTDSLYAL